MIKLFRKEFENWLRTFSVLISITYFLLAIYYLMQATIHKSTSDFLSFLFYGTCVHFFFLNSLLSEDDEEEYDEEEEN